MSYSPAFAPFGGRPGIAGAPQVASPAYSDLGMNAALGGVDARQSATLRPSSAARGSAAPGSGSAQPGAGGGSAAGGGSGFFFFGVAALLSLAALLVPRVLCTLRIFWASRAPSPYLLLLERPG
jgi:hypothetical protein